MYIGGLLISNINDYRNQTNYVIIMSQYVSTNERDLGFLKKKLNRIHTRKTGRHHHHVQGTGGGVGTGGGEVAVGGGAERIREGMEFSNGEARRRFRERIRLELGIK